MAAINSAADLAIDGEVALWCENNARRLPAR
jgi:hypothetical protein